MNATSTSASSAHDAPAWIPVQSTAISHLRHWNPRDHRRVREPVCEVRFLTSGKVWAYKGVSARLFQSFLHADSIGRFFGRVIRGRFREIEGGIE